MDAEEGMRMKGISSARAEAAPLKTVLLHRPGPEVGKVDDLAAAHYERPILSALLDEEFTRISAVFAGLGVEVLWLQPVLGPDEDRKCLLNMMYARDLFFMAPKGAVLSRMAFSIRRGEVAHARVALEAADIPIVHEIDGDGTFEGADALWIRKDLVAVGVGKRTNSEAFRQLQRLLAEDGVHCIALPPPDRTQHLLGGIQLVGCGKVLVRTGIVAPRVTDFLTEQGLFVVAIPENEEVRSRQAMNVVVTAPAELVMPARCPQTRALYERAGLRIGAEVEISQLINGGGGLACATGIVRRG
jgi:N-dimethylarginine dimethylaminohydrolase